jgi:hypothetical protein
VRKNESGRIFAGLIVLTLFAWGSTTYAEQKQKSEDCLACHSTSTLTRDTSGKKPAPHVDAEKFKNSIHGSMFTCVDCHTEQMGPGNKKTRIKPACSQCHAEAAEAYSHSFHAKASSNGAPAATCEDCHGSVHEIVIADDPKSPVNHDNIPTTCGSMHGLPRLAFDSARQRRQISDL